MIGQYQIFEILRNTITQASTTVSEVERQTLLGSANLLVNELLLRQNHNFYRDFYLEGYQLAHQGIEVCKALSIDCQSSFNEIAKLPSQVRDGDSPNATLRNIDRLWEIQAGMVAILPTRANESVTDFMDALNHWEVKLYAYRESMAEELETDLVKESEYSGESFLAYLQSRKPEWKNLRMHDFFKIGGGFSKVTLLMDLEDDTNGQHALAVRVQPSITILDLLCSDVENEFPVVQLAYDEGVTVAEPLWLETDTSIFGSKFFVSRRVTGENLGSAKGATSEITAPMVEGLARESAKIHNISLTTHAQRMGNSALADWCGIKTIEEST